MIARKRSTTWLATLVFLTALLSLGPLARLLRGVGIVGDPLVVRLLLPTAIGMILYSVVRFWLWRLAGDRPGSSLLLWAGTLGLLGLLSPFAFLFARLAGSGVEPPPTFLIYGDALLVLAAMTLMPFGLLQSGIVPIRVFWLGIASALAFGAWLLPWGGEFVSGVTRGTGVLLDAGFLVALGLQLLRHPESVEE